MEELQPNNSMPLSPDENSEDLAKLEELDNANPEIKAEEPQTDWGEATLGAANRAHQKTE